MSTLTMYFLTVNIAIGKPVTQSTTQPSETGGATYQATMAVDGDTSGTLPSPWSCAHTTQNVVPAWWMVDLQQNYSIYQIKVTAHGKLNQSMSKCISC